MLLNGKQRMVRSEVFKLMKFARLSSDVKWYLYALMAFADDAGNIELDVEVLSRKMDLSVEPIPTDTMEEWNSVLEGADLLAPYYVDGVRYASIVGWNDKTAPLYQRIERASDSKWRNPSPEGASTHEENTEAPVPSRRRSGVGPDSVGAGNRSTCEGRLPRRRFVRGTDGTDRTENVGPRSRGRVDERLAPKNPVVPAVREGRVRRVSAPVFQLKTEAGDRKSLPVARRKFRKSTEDGTGGPKAEGVRRHGEEAVAERPQKVAKPLKRVRPRKDAQLPTKSSLRRSERRYDDDDDVASVMKRKLDILKGMWEKEGYVAPRNQPPKKSKRKFLS